MTTFVDENREEYGVEPTVTVADRPVHLLGAQAAEPGNPSGDQPDVAGIASYSSQIHRVGDELRGVRSPQGVGQLHREGVEVARWTVERLMRLEGLKGVVRGETKRTTIPDEDAARPADLVDRQFEADRPDRPCGSPTSPMFGPGRASRMWRWGSTRTHGSSSAGEGREQVYEPTWLSTPWNKHSGHADPTQPDPDHRLVHHSDAGGQYLSIRYTEPAHRSRHRTISRLGWRFVR